MLGNKFMQQIKKRLLPCLISAALLAGMAPATGASQGAAKTTLPEQAVALYNNSYRSLADRITERGYAPTSLTGAYQGMFIRDTSIQIMAHTAYGETDLSRSLLDYLLSYHVGFGAQRAAHVIPNFQDEAYGNSFIPLRDDPEVKPEDSLYYDSQEDLA